MKTRMHIGVHKTPPHLGLLLSNYQDGLVTPTEQELVERHLLECERCRGFLGDLQQARDSIHELPKQSSPKHEDFNAIMSCTIYKDTWV